jgi:hypothetical protein
VAIRNGVPVRFTPQGICDAFDSTNAFQGACAVMQNLVFDQGNPEIIVSRPGVGAPLTSFASFTTPTFVSIQIVIGTVVYGMVATARNAGHDEPFAYDTASNTFITISGVTAANTPSSLTTTGPWIPPVMTVVGPRILVAHPGFSGTGTNYFGVIDITNPSAPAWSSTNTATNALPTVPTAVANFNNRAYFVCGNVLYFSDVLAPTTRTNASQSITVGDSTLITTLCGLPIQTTSAGVLGALVAFKGGSIWQITGDSTTNNLALNYLSLTTGCVSPRSAVQCPFGIFFAGVDSPYILSLTGTLGPLSHDAGANQGQADLQQPFQNATQPTRMAAAFSGNIYRVCLATIVKGATATNDYWYGIRRARWTGPHTFTYDCASQISDSFILSGIDHGAALYRSDAIPTATSSYTDNGVALTSHLTTSSFPKTGHMAEVQVIESTLELSSSGASVNYNIAALNDQASVIGSTFVLTPATGFLWGTGFWGTGVWSTGVNIPHVYSIPWKAPLVFQKMSLDVTATSSNSVSIGTFYARYQDTGYTNMGS